MKTYIKKNIIKIKPICNYTQVIHIWENVEKENAIVLKKIWFSVFAVDCENLIMIACVFNIAIGNWIVELHIKINFFIMLPGWNIDS